MRHLLIDVQHNFFVYLIDTTGYDEYISMFWVSSVENPKPLYIIEWSQTGQDLNITAITA